MHQVERLPSGYRQVHRVHRHPTLRPIAAQRAKENEGANRTNDGGPCGDFEYRTKPEAVLQKRRANEGEVQTNTECIEVVVFD